MLSSKHLSEHDVLIIGTGIGGSTLGYALSQPGRSLLFIEQGLDLSDPGCISGLPAEASNEFAVASKDEQAAVLARAGRNPEWYEDGLRHQAFRPFVGFGTGGSSSLYGMVLERRFPHDFDEWPLGYEELAPWYDQAEALYEVSGAPDPLHPSKPGCLLPPPPLDAANGAVFDRLRRSGLHPYQLHVACRRLPACRSCQGYLCSSISRCKNDARTVCLTPALSRGDSLLLTGARALRLLIRGRRVTGVVVLHRGEQIELRARVVVLAAGALSTPRILRASGNLANSSGLVGRRLMRHAIDLFVLTLAPRIRRESESKQLGLSDFYADRLGVVQSFGMPPPLEYLRGQPGRNLWRTLGPLAVPVSRLFQGAPIIASILEDQPSEDNCVELTDGAPRIWYRPGAQDAARREKFRRLILRTFARFGAVPVFGTSERKALGHVCGTTMFGLDARKSVLDANNRANDFDNLYVVDASFFPTSGGVNPALTIAANALRVAKHLQQVLS